MSRVTFFELSASNYNASITFFNRVFNREFSVVEESMYWLIRRGNDDSFGINGDFEKRK